MVLPSHAARPSDASWCLITAGQSIERLADGNGQFADRRLVRLGRVPLSGERKDELEKLGRRGRG
jgi:hypothetical protein